MRGGRGVARNVISATTTTRRLRRPLHHTLCGPAPPLSRGRMKSNLVLAARCAPEVCKQRSEFSVPSQERGSGAPRGASNQCPRHTIRCRHLNVRGARKRAIDGSPLAFRRSTAALAKALTPWLSSRPCFLGRGPGGRYAGLVNRLLSFMTWCDDQYAILQEGWSGNPVPVPVPKRDLGFTTAHTWLFDRKIPVAPEARKALGIYREGRNAEQNYLISYAVLSYYKIVELKHRGRSEAREWFETNYAALKDDRTLANELARFEKARGTEKPGDYLYRACRVAVAHANAPYSSDPDDTASLSVCMLLRRFCAHLPGASFGKSWAFRNAPTMEAMRVCRSAFSHYFLFRPLCQPTAASGTESVEAK